MLASPGRRWWVLPLPARLPCQRRSVSSGVARLSNEYYGKGWRRPSSLRPRSQGMEISGVSHGLGFRGGEVFGFFRVNVWW